MKQYKMINLETINLITTCVDKYKQALSMYDIKGERNNFFTCDKKEKACDGCVFIYECGKILLY